jgi:hypothetical protein
MSLEALAAGPDRVVLEFPTSQRCDFAAVDDSGRTVWRWSHGMAFLQAFGREVLEPAEPGLRCVESWIADVAPGRYLLVGTLTLSTGPLADTAAIRVGD